MRTDARKHRFDSRPCHLLEARCWPGYLISRFGRAPRTGWFGGTSEVMVVEGHMTHSYECFVIFIVANIFIFHVIKNILSK